MVGDPTLPPCFLLKGGLPIGMRIPSLCHVAAWMRCHGGTDKTCARVFFEREMCSGRYHHHSRTVFLARVAQTALQGVNRSDQHQAHTSMPARAVAWGRGVVQRN